MTEVLKIERLENDFIDIFTTEIHSVSLSLRSNEQRLLIFEKQVPTICNVSAGEVCPDLLTQVV